MEKNFKEEGYFVILSSRNNEFPEQLGLTNKSMITYLIDIILYMLMILYC